MVPSIRGCNNLQIIVHFNTRFEWHSFLDCITPLYTNMTNIDKLKNTITPLRLHAASSLRIPNSTHSFRTLLPTVSIKPLKLFPVPSVNVHGTSNSYTFNNNEGWRIFGNLTFIKEKFSFYSLLSIPRFRLRLLVSNELKVRPLFFVNRLICVKIKPLFIFLPLLHSGVGNYLIAFAPNTFVLKFKFLFLVKTDLY